MKNQTNVNEVNAVAAEAERLRLSLHGNTNWPDEFKSRVVALTRNGMPVSEVMRVTGIYRSLIDRWCRAEVLAAKPTFTEMSLVNRRDKIFKAESGEKHVLLTTPRGFVVTLSVAAMIALAESGVL